MEHNHISLTCPACKIAMAEIELLRAKLEIAEDAIKELASRAHNRLAELHDMQPDYQHSST